MSQTGPDFIDRAVATRVEIIKPRAYHYFNFTTGGSIMLAPQGTTLGNNAWQINNRNILTAHFRSNADGHRGGSFFIHVFPGAEGNPATSLNLWRVFHIAAGDVNGTPQTNIVGLRLPPLYCYFEVLAAEANLQVECVIILEGAD